MTELVKIESTQLEKVVNESGLEIQEGEQIKQSYLPFLNELAEIQAQSSKINFDNPTQIDESIARELRLRTVKIRTGSEALKDSRKKIHLLKGNLEQAAFNLISASCKLTEETFLNVEKAREIAEKKRKEILKADRIEKLIPYDVQVEFYDLANMPEETFTALLDGFKKAYEDRIAAEKKAEEDRIAKEKAEAEERERMRIENEKLKKEAEKAAIAAEAERRKQAEILAKQKAEFEARQAELAKKAEEERKKIEEINRIEREKQAAILKKQQEEAAKLQAELTAKKEAEAKEAKRIADENAAKELAEKQAAMAPDKEKLKEWINKLMIGITPSVGAKAHVTACNIQDKFSKFMLWANEQIDTL